MEKESIEELIDKVNKHSGTTVQDSVNVELAARQIFYLKITMGLTIIVIILAIIQFFITTIGRSGC